jgi:hypothetical protein
VLAAERPHRLSYPLDDPPGSPSVYVTWELRRTDDGTIIRLNVDEPWPLADNTEDLETHGCPSSPAWSSTLNEARLRRLRKDKMKRAGERPPAKVIR